MPMPGACMPSALRMYCTESKHSDQTSCEHRADEVPKLHTTLLLGRKRSVRQWDENKGKKQKCVVKARRGKTHLLCRIGCNGENRPRRRESHPSTQCQGIRSEHETRIIVGHILLEQLTSPSVTPTSQRKNSACSNLSTLTNFPFKSVYWGQPLPVVFCSCDEVKQACHSYAARRPSQERVCA